MQRRSVPIVQAYGLTELQLASRVQGGDEDSDADDDASMGKLMRTYGLFHSIAEGFHIISSSLGVFIWGMATVGLFYMQGECDDTDPAKMARCFHETECETDIFTGQVTSCPAACPADGVSLQRICDLIDGALLALNLSLGPQVLVLTALVMFTSVQVCLHTCCFGETTKKGAACTYMVFCILGALVSIWTLIESYIFIDDMKSILRDMGASNEDVDQAQDDATEEMVLYVLDSPIVSFWIFTTVVTFILRVGGTVLKVKKHGMCC